MAEAELHQKLEGSAAGDSEEDMQDQWVDIDARITKQAEDIRRASAKATEHDTVIREIRKQ
eukprot:5945410-Alexandrium_andersonii.AAC.1